MTKAVKSYPALQLAVAGDKPKLHTVHIKLTDECNLSCGYCYAESGCQSKEMLSFEELKMIATEASKIASKIDFVLSGENRFCIQTP